MKLKKTCCIFEVSSHRRQTSFFSDKHRSRSAAKRKPWGAKSAARTAAHPVRRAGREAAPGSALPVWLPGHAVAKALGRPPLVPAAMQSTASRSTASVLAELQWDDGYAVPMANAENRALEEDVSAGLRLWGCGCGAELRFTHGGGCAGGSVRSARGAQERLGYVWVLAGAGCRPAVWVWAILVTSSRSST